MESVVLASPGLPCESGSVIVGTSFPNARAFTRRFRCSFGRVTNRLPLNNDQTETDCRESTSAINSRPGWNAKSVAAIGNCFNILPFSESPNKRDRCRLWSFAEDYRRYALPVFDNTILGTVTPPLKCAATSFGTSSLRNARPFAIE